MPLFVSFKKLLSIFEGYKYIAPFALKSKAKNYKIFLTPESGAINLGLMALKMPSHLVLIRTSDAKNFVVQALRMNNSEEPFRVDDY